MSMTMTDVDLTPFEIVGIPEGATLTATVESIRLEVLSDINAEFDPSEAPVD